MLAKRNCTIYDCLNDIRPKFCIKTAIWEEKKMSAIGFEPTTPSSKVEHATTMPWRPLIFVHENIWLTIKFKLVSITHALCQLPQCMPFFLSPTVDEKGKFLLQFVKLKHCPEANVIPGWKMAVCRRDVCKRGILKYPIINILNFRGWIKRNFWHTQSHNITP